MDVCGLDRTNKNENKSFKNEVQKNKKRKKINFHFSDLQKIFQQCDQCDVR